MAQMRVLGGGLYNNPTFMDLMNKNYSSVDAMRVSIAKLKAAPTEIDIATMEYGQYQSILSPLSQWPANAAQRWRSEMGGARLQLTAQPNSVPLSNDEPKVVPLTRCALLDASLRKCFNSEPPIPITIDVQQKGPSDQDPDQHDIKLDWEYANGVSNPPTHLNFTMICPYRPV